MPSLDSREFWVIFDTGTRTEYYRDVHNVLALPKGAVVRYEYREAYLSDRAMRLALDQESAPARVLLIYAQKPGFGRGDGNTAAGAPPEDMRWIGTRLATMRAIPRTSGANFFFDLSVEGYPKSDREALRKLLAPLIEKLEVPFLKWVAVSDDLSAYNDLVRGEEEANWAAIVDRISAKDMQFRDDSFWRLKPANPVAQARLVTEVEAVGDKPEIRQVSSFYGLSPNDVCTFEAISYTPAGRPVTQPSRSLRIQFDDGGPLTLEGSREIELRQYTGKILKFKAGIQDREDAATEVVTFETASDQSVWPDGPAFELVFQVRQQSPVAIPAAQDAPADGAGGPEPAQNTESEPEPGEAGADVPEEPKVISLKPWTVLQAAIQSVPAVKYALGVAGLASAAAIALGFFQSPGAALVGTVVVFVLAVLLFLFTIVTQAAKGWLLWPALFLTWSLAIIFVLSLGLTISTAFFAYPMPYSKLIRQFQPTRRESIVVVAMDKANDSPVAGALATLESPDGTIRAFTDAEGKAFFAGIPVEEGRYASSISAAGYQDSKTDLDPSNPARRYVVFLSRLPEVPVPARPPVRKERQAPPAASKTSASANMNGTWQILVTGDINNVRLRDGTFQFRPQSNGAILADANFVLDDMPVTLSGSASAVGSQVFLKFNAKNDAGGAWSGRGTFSMESAARMSGRIEPKSGDGVPLTLKKILK